jgi:hypothetical protein
LLYKKNLLNIKNVFPTITKKIQTFRINNYELISEKY